MSQERKLMDRRGFLIRVGATLFTAASLSDWVLGGIIGHANRRIGEATGTNNVNVVTLGLESQKDVSVCEQAELLENHAISENCRILAAEETAANVMSWARLGARALEVVSAVMVGKGVRGDARCESPLIDMCII